MMKYILTPIFFITLLFMGSNAYALDPFEKDIEAVREIYLDATDGNKRKVRKAIKFIRKIENKYKDHPLLLIYKGGALSLRGMDIGARPLNRMRETEEGLNIIDRSLRQLSNYKASYLEVAEAKLVATYIFINLPDDIFHRLKEGEQMSEQLLAHPRLSEMPKGMQAAIYFAAATSAKRFKNEPQYKHYLELTIATDADGKNGKEAQLLLKEVAG